MALCDRCERSDCTLPEAKAEVDKAHAAWERAGSNLAERRRFGMIHYEASVRYRTAAAACAGSVDWKAKYEALKAEIEMTK